MVGCGRYIKQVTPERARAAGCRVLSGRSRSEKSVRGAILLQEPELSQRLMDPVSEMNRAYVDMPAGRAIAKPVKHIGSKTLGRDGR